MFFHLAPTVSSPCLLASPEYLDSSSSSFPFPEIHLYVPQLFITPIVAIYFHTVYKYPTTHLSCFLTQVVTVTSLPGPISVFPN